MAKGFTLSVYPWVYIAKYGESWSERFIEKPHLSPEEEEVLGEEELQHLLEKRNSFPELPLVNYTTQYGMGCFEGMKGFPWKDGSLRLFRPDMNAKRMFRSMEGLMMPGYPTEMFVEAARELVGRNRKLGFAPPYDPAWEADDFLSGESVYIRPFSYSEPGIGLGVSKHPFIVMISTPVGAFFQPGSNKALVSDKARAFPGGTGWIKCDSNYVVPILEKKAAEAEGFMEAIFLDATEHRYVEEGSSCNIFFLLEDDTLVTPELGDTILPGITRSSVLQIASGLLGLKVEERTITIEEAMERSKECFVTGTAAGVSHIESITLRKGGGASWRSEASRASRASAPPREVTKVFGDGSMGDVSRSLLKTLKGIQYGKVEDSFGWMVEVI